MNNIAFCAVQQRGIYYAYSHMAIQTGYHWESVPMRQYNHETHLANLAVCFIFRLDISWYNNQRLIMCVCVCVCVHIHTSSDLCAHDCKKKNPVVMGFHAQYGMEISYTVLTQVHVCIGRSSQSRSSQSWSSQSRSSQSRSSQSRPASSSAWRWAAQPSDLLFPAITHTIASI